MHRLVGTVVLAGVLLPMPLSGQAPPQEPPAGLNQWQPSKNNPEVLYMTLVGDRTKPGAYVYRVKAPDGLRIPPHWHTQTLHLTILSGTLVMAMGGSPDPNRARRFPSSSFVVVPKDMRHVEWFEGETVVHVETEGPFETVFVDPADDPRSHPRP
jgi:hypothetical protein